MSRINTVSHPLKSSQGCIVLQNRLVNLSEFGWGSHGCLTATATDWRNFETHQALKKDREVGIVFLIQVLRAETTGDTSRLISLKEIQKNPSTSNLWIGDQSLEGRIPWQEEKPSLECRLESLEENSDQAEFVWNGALYKARKAAQEFSKETHADY